LVIARDACEDASRRRRESKDNGTERIIQKRVGSGREGVSLPAVRFIGREGETR